jgi:hypothetical protein
LDVDDSRFLFFHALSKNDFWAGSRNHSTVSWDWSWISKTISNDTCPQSDKWICPSSRINPPINGFLSTWFKHEPYWSAPLMWTILVPCHLVCLMGLLASDSVV